MKKQSKLLIGVIAAVAVLAVVIISIVMAATGGGKDTTAATMHLKRTEGAVTVSDDAGKDVPLLEDLGLYSGYGVDTRSESYAWINLDDVKLIKMDQESEISIQKEGKVLEIAINSGSLFFNVTKPLEDDETMDISTSTMLVGIRGTCGWVEDRNGFSRVYVLEGTVECSAGDQTVQVNAGEMAELAADGGLVVQSFTVQDIPEFVEVDLVRDPDLCNDIYEASGLDVMGIAGGEEDAGQSSEEDILEAADGEGDAGQNFGEDIPETVGGEEQAPPVTFIPWSEAGLEDHVMDWQDDELSDLMHYAIENWDMDAEIMLSEVWELRAVDAADFSYSISNISALGELKNLTYLRFSYNPISDISALSGLTNLTEVELEDAQISDISALSGLTNLKKLWLDNNQISDISALSGLTNLEDLWLHSNSISDINALSELKNLTYLNLRDNPVKDYSPVEFIEQNGGTVLK